MNFARPLRRKLVLVFLLIHGIAAAQELEPRAYSRSPVGTTFAAIAFGRSSGGVSFDPSVPLTDVHATLYSTGIGLGQTFPLLGRQALATISLPYAWGDVSGRINELSGTTHRSGTADIRARLSVNLYGSPALWPSEFAAVKKRSLVIGTSLTINA